MTFNQWHAGKNCDSQMRLALNAVWDAMLGECDGLKAGRLLSELLEALPDPAGEEDWDD